MQQQGSYSRLSTGTTPSEQSSYSSFKPNGVPIQNMANIARRPELAPGLHASCPMICAAYATQAGPIQYVPLQFESMQWTVECHIATAFVVVRFVCVMPVNINETRCYFFLPKHYDATVTDVVIQNLSQDGTYATCIIPNDEAQKFQASGVSAQGQLPASDGYNPELFVLMMGKVQPGDKLFASIIFFQPLLFENGHYKLTLPAEIHSACMPPNKSLNQLLQFQVAINTGTPEEVKFICGSHPVKIMEKQQSRVKFEANSQTQWANQDFEIGYKVWGDAIVASCNIQEPQENDTDLHGDFRGTFCVTVAPPEPDSVPQVFSRSVVFVIDRSGSMTGDPIEYAKEALEDGIKQLQQFDEFTIIAFDHKQLFWAESLAEASEQNKQNAIEWVKREFKARGLTDILTPVQQALTVLSTARGVPYVFLMTDGAVENERDICYYMDDFNRQPRPDGGLTARLSTFAIGPYCNHFFLRQLAVSGRGAFDVAFRPHAIKTQIQRMLVAASKPILTDLTLGIQGLQSCELYPYPIPDLFCGLPLLVSGKYLGDWPASITLNGKLPRGQVWTQQVDTIAAADIQLEKVFIKQRLDLLTARAWVEDDASLKSEVVKLSMASGVPVPQHTTLVGFETTKLKYDEFKRDKAKGKKINVQRYAIAGAAGVAVLGGAALAIGFGSVAATLQGMSAGDAIAGMDGGAAGDLFGGADCCEGDCLECFDNCIECCEPCMSACGI